MSGSDVFLQLMDTKVAVLLHVLFNSKDEFYLRELAKKAELPVTSTFRAVNSLVKLGVVSVYHVKRLKLYRIAQNEKSQALAPLFRKDIKVVDAFVGLVQGLKGLQAVYQHGDVEQDRVNLLLIGDNLDEGELKGAVASVKEKFGFAISYIAVTLEQYKQMSQMGLWKGQKRMVWGK